MYLWAWIPRFLRQHIRARDALIPRKIYIESTNFDDDIEKEDSIINDVNNNQTEQPDQQLPIYKSFKMLSKAADGA